MKRIVLAALWVLTSVCAYSQSWTPNQYTQSKGLIADSALRAPRLDTIWKGGNKDSIGGIVYRPADKSLWIKTDTGWAKVGSGFNISDYVPTTRSVNTLSPLSGGGNLTADRTLSIANAQADGENKGAATFRSDHFDDDTQGAISLQTDGGNPAWISALTQSKITGLQDSLNKRIDTVYWNSTNDTLYAHTSRSLYRLPAINWSTKLTPLMTQPALPPQPTDSIPQAIGKIFALYNSIPGTYIENQKSANQTADMRITGDVQASGVGLYGGWYSSGLAGAITHVGVTGGIGQLMAFNRTTSAYFNLSINGATTIINSGSSGNVGIRNGAPSFNLDITGTTRIGGANYKLFIDRTAVATQDNVIAFRSVGVNTSTDTVSFIGNASRADNSFFIMTRQGDMVLRIPVGNLMHFSTHVDGNGTSRKDMMVWKDGNLELGDSLISPNPTFPVKISRTKDTSLVADHKIVANGVISTGARAAPFLGTAITANTTLNDSHHTIRVTTAGVTITFPTASLCPGRELEILNHSGANINVTSYTNETGTAGNTTIAAGVSFFRNDGTNWYKLK